MDIERNPGSFRDPAGGVYQYNGRIFRSVSGSAAEVLPGLAEQGFYKDLVSRGLLTPFISLTEEEAREVGPSAGNPDLLVEQPRLPFISYYSEWPFEMLKAAALCQLAVTRTAFAHDYLVKDATPFNVQFNGASATFIDLASLEPYEEGAAWTGYAQFCRMFLNPLLLQSIRGIPFQAWLRGSPEGIDVHDLRRVLPLRSKLRKSIFQDVVLQDWLNGLARNQKASKSVASRPIPASIISGLMQRMERQIASLKPKRSKTAWSDYEATKAHYSPDGNDFKERFVSDAVAQAKPGLLVDLGCNAGEYSVIAAREAGFVVGVDFDEASVGLMYKRVRDKHRNVLPLVVDLLSPSPAVGWANRERPSFLERCDADMFLCQALVHHLAIGGNVPLEMIVDWLASVAPAGVVEFVPKEDPMVQRLLATRKDVFGSYSQQEFERILEGSFCIRERGPVPGSSRVLYALEAA